MRIQSVNHEPSITSISVTVSMPLDIAPSRSTMLPSRASSRRPDGHQQHRVGDAAADRDHRERRVAGEARQHDRQHAPGGGVVERAGGERQRAERRPRQAALVDDARQHRERGDRHRRAHEQHRLEPAHAGREELAVAGEERRQHAAEKEGHDDARERHRERAAQPLAGSGSTSNSRPIRNMYSDQADLAHREQDRHRLASGRRSACTSGQHQPEQRRSHQHAGDHLAHDLRLTDALREPADQRGRRRG